MVKAAQAPQQFTFHALRPMLSFFNLLEHLRTPITLLVVPNTLSSTSVTAYHIAAFGAHLEVLPHTSHSRSPKASSGRWGEKMLTSFKVVDPPFISVELNERMNERLHRTSNVHGVFTHFY